MKNKSKNNYFFLTITTTTTLSNNSNKNVLKTKEQRKENLTQIKFQLTNRINLHRERERTQKKLI